MKIKVRYVTYETNSSSIHALVIQNKNVSKEDMKYTLTIKHGDYGWEREFYDWPNARVSYMCQALVTHKKSQEAEEALKPLLKIFDKYGIKYEFEDDYFKPDDWGDLDGYIDHVEEVYDFFIDMMHSDKKVLRFIFGDDSAIYTGNDNDDFEWYEDIDKEHADCEVYIKGN